MPPFYMLAFEHRSTFRKLVFGSCDPISEAEREQLIAFKHVIWEGVRKAAEIRGSEGMVISVDEEYGEEIHREAHRQEIKSALPVEKSGRPTFEFEYSNWQEHLRHIRPAIAKAFVQITPIDQDPGQLERLRNFSEFCRAEGFAFLLEPIILPADSELVLFGSDKKRFDREFRPQRVIEAVKRFLSAAIFPDIWKIEGAYTAEAMQDCIRAINAGGSQHQQIIVSGRGGNREEVETWLRIGARFPEVVGFAIGRTIFAEAIKGLYHGEISSEEASERIAAQYLHYIDVFETAKKDHADTESIPV